MKWKSYSIPEASQGVTYPGVKKAVVPNMAMSLQEILHRFTRGEPLEIGRELNFHESEDDLEKIAHMDPVDRAEFIQKQKDTQKEYARQERVKATREKERLEKVALEKIIEERREAAKKSAVASPTP